MNYELGNKQSYNIIDFTKGGNQCWDGNHARSPALFIDGKTNTFHFTYCIEGFQYERKIEIQTRLNRFEFKQEINSENSHSLFMTHNDELSLITKYHPEPIYNVAVYVSNNDYVAANIEIKKLEVFEDLNNQVRPV